MSREEGFEPVTVSPTTTRSQEVETGPFGKEGLLGNREPASLYQALNRFLESSGRGLRVHQKVVRMTGYK